MLLDGIRRQTCRPGPTSIPQTESEFHTPKVSGGHPRQVGDAKESFAEDSDSD